MITVPTPFRAEKRFILKANEPTGSQEYNHVTRTYKGYPEGCGMPNILPII
jgi:hypothetical protein